MTYTDGWQGEGDISLSHQLNINHQYQVIEFGIPKKTQYIFSESKIPIKSRKFELFFENCVLNIVSGFLNTWHSKKLLINKNM